MKKDLRKVNDVDLKTSEETKMDNPKVQKGDKILITAVRNISSTYIGKVFEVTSTPGIENFAAKCIETNSSAMTIYTQPNSCPDSFIMADRKSQAKYLKTKVEQMETEIRKTKQEIDMLEKYPTEEDFVAAKLDKILKAKGPKQIATILKELKTSNYL